MIAAVSSGTYAPMRSAPDWIVSQGTDWRFRDKLNAEVKA
jgi:hypothetical protein